MTRARREPPHPDRSLHLKAPETVLDVWRSFDGFVMETLTKAWVFDRHGGRQRTVDEMERHRRRYGASGNCFDLAIWLLERLRKAGIEALFVSDRIEGRDAHVAVVAARGGRRYLCDLGDMWLQPIAIDHEVATPVRGFFPAADIALERQGARLTVSYHRPGGKSSRQSYDLTPISEQRLLEKADANQRYLAQALVEARDFEHQAHWEYENGVIRRSTNQGLFEVESGSKSEAAGQIAEKTGMDAAYVLECLQILSRVGLLKKGPSGDSEKEP